VLVGTAHAQPSRLKMTACQLFAELELYPTSEFRNNPTLVAGYIRTSIDRIFERGKLDRDPKVQDATFQLIKASLLTKDHGEKYFSSPQRAVDQLRRDVQDAMTAMGQVCDSKAPSRALTPAEIEAQTKRAQENVGTPGAKCTTKVYGGGAAVTVCE
jgi:hypothetical protein